ncbi:MAG: CYTH domain-containing protein [Planctomycetes bacterium]|nr:CYTH domain-containing protein [Planctomycetota bacterium]
MEEREYKFVLTGEKYRELAERLRGDAETELQENFFFDSGGALEAKQWVLRLRLSGKIRGGRAEADGASLYGMKVEPGKAEYTLKGPARSKEGLFIRAEVEAAADPAAALEAARSGKVCAGDLPEALREAVREITGRGEEAALEITAEFRNLRLRMTDGGVEVSLDRTETRDGRVRHELEIETAADGDSRAMEIINEAGADGMQAAETGKYVFARGKRD